MEAIVICAAIESLRAVPDVARRILADHDGQVAQILDNVRNGSDYREALLERVRSTAEAHLATERTNVQSYVTAVESAIERLSATDATALTAELAAAQEAAMSSLGAADAHVAA